MNTNKLHEVLDDAFKEIERMTPEELDRKMKEHENGEFARILEESGALELIMTELRTNKAKESIMNARMKQTDKEKVIDILNRVALDLKRENLTEDEEKLLKEAIGKNWEKEVFGK